MRRIVLFAALFAPAACLACEAVPEVTFDEGGLDAQPNDGGGDGDNDADAPSDTSVVTSTCPDAAPPGATVCCGPVACAGAGCATRCADCQGQACPELCCAKNTTANPHCSTFAQGCP